MARGYEESYRAFLAMPEREWLGLIVSLLRGGTLEWPDEQRAFEDASEKRFEDKEREGAR